MVHTGARPVDMDNRSESPEKASNYRHDSNLVVEDQEYLAVMLSIAATLRPWWVKW
jgi:hypothetical protein